MDIFFQGAANRTVYCGGKYYHAFQNDGKISSIALGRWTPETQKQLLILDCLQRII